MILSVAQSKKIMYICHENFFAKGNFNLDV